MNTAQSAAANAASQHSGRLAGVGRGLSRFVSWITEFPAAILLVIEIVLLLANVVFRYLLHAPLSWGDELASVFFIWLAMLGAVIAVRRGEHMRLTTFVSHMSGRRRQFLDTFGIVVVLTFIVLLVPPAWEYVEEEWVISMPVLEIAHSYRVAAIAVGLLLMILELIAQLLLKARLKDCIFSFAVAAVIAAILWGAAPALASIGSANLLVFFLLGVTVMVSLAIPIMTAFGLATVGYLLTVTNTPAIVVVGRLDEGISHAVLLAVPLFVFLGALIEAMGLARAMIQFLASLLGHVRGGLSYVLVVAMYLVSGISGSKTADMAAVAPALFPEMKKRGEHEGELVAMLSASGAMSETIPPSLVLITIGSVTGVSIAALFIGGLMPAVVGALAMCCVIAYKNRRTVSAPVQRARWSEIRKSFVFAAPAVALPFVIRGAVVEGVATATEVATIGVVYTFVVGLLIYRCFDWRRLMPILVETASLSGAILIIIGCATAMAWALTQSGFSHQLAAFMAMVPGGATGFLLISALAFVVLGSFLEGIPAIVLFAPLLFPIAREVGVHEVHYAMVAVFAMGLGLFMPPFGIGFYVACAISKVDPNMAIWRIWPYLGALIVALLIIIAVPWISVGFL